jgi:hypothetical protein
LASRCDCPGHTYFPLFEINIGAGGVESDILPWTETILVMEIMDQVREIGGLKYPGRIEQY